MDLGSVVGFKSVVPTTHHYLLDSISASMHVIDCVKRVQQMINSQPYVTPLAGLFIGGVLPAALGSLIRKRSWLYEKKNKERERASKLPGVGGGWARRARA